MNFRWACPANGSGSGLQKSRRRAWITTFVIFTLLVLAGGGLWLYNFLNQPPAEPVRVAIPAVEKPSESEALQALYDAKLRPQIKRVQHRLDREGHRHRHGSAGGIVAGTELGDRPEHFVGPQCRQDPGDAAGTDGGGGPRYPAAGGTGGRAVHHHGQQRHCPGGPGDHHQAGAGPAGGGGQHR